MRLRILYILALLLLFANVQNVVAQIRFNASIELSQNDDDVTKARIYSCTTSKDAEKVLELLKKHEEPKLVKKAIPKVEANSFIRNIGTFSIEVTDNYDAVVIVWCEGYEPIKITKNELGARSNIVLEKDDKTLKEVVVEEETEKEFKPYNSRSKEFNGMMTIYADFIIPFRIKPNMRVVAQPILYDRTDITDINSDSLFAFRCVVYNDKDEYRVSQKRRMNFHPELHDSMQYINSVEKPYIIYDTIYNDGKISLVEKEKSNIRFVPGKDTIYVHVIDTVTGCDPDPSHPYPQAAKVQIVDYNTIVYSDIKKDNGERWAPFKFLESRFGEFLPPAQPFFEEQLNVSNRDSAELRLKFDIGDSRISRSDSSNVVLLNMLRNTLLEIKNDPENRSLDNVKVYGMASPDGGLEYNKNLAKRRAQSLVDEIRQYIDRPVDTSESQVVPWSIVADSLERDGFKAMADEMRVIIEEHKNNLTLQGVKIAKMPSYDKKVMDQYLDKFRSVRYIFEEIRIGKKEPDRLMADYKKDPRNVLRSGYWLLFNNVHDIELLKDMARNSLETTRRKAEINDAYHNNGYWAYAAGMLAHTYVKTDTIDFTVLDPFLDLNLYEKDGEKVVMGIDSLRDFNTRNIHRYINAPEMAANQLIMTIRSNSPTRKNKIEILEHIIKEGGHEAKYDTLLAFSRCIRGDYEKDSLVRQKVAAISKTNAVILNLAMFEQNKNKKYLQATVSDTVYLPDNSVSDYLKAVICMKSDSLNMAKVYLTKSFCKDLSKIPVANNDRDMLVEENSENIITDALEMWKEAMPEYIKSRNRKKISTTDRVVVPDSVANGNVLASDSTMAIASDSTLQKKAVESYKEMSDEEYRNTPFAMFIDSYEKLTDTDTDNDASAVETLYKVFDKERKYISVFNVMMVRDSSINKDTKELKKLRDIRDGYNRLTK